MVIPSRPAAPPLAFTRFHALSMFCRERICSNRSSEAVPCSRTVAPESAWPVGLDAFFSDDGVEPLPTSSGLRSKVWELLCPLLTSVPSRRSSRTVAPSVAEVLGAQISLSKDVNSCCTTGPFISGTEHRAALCGASLPVPSTLYGLSVRRLISFDRWLPSHETSRLRSCFGLMFESSCLSL